MNWIRLFSMPLAVDNAMQATVKAEPATIAAAREMAMRMVSVKRIALKFWQHQHP